MDTTTDEGISAERSGLSEALDRIANGGAELLVTLRLDRLLSNFLVEYRARVVRQPV